MVAREAWGERRRRAVRGCRQRPARMPTEAYPPEEKEEEDAVTTVAIATLGRRRQQQAIRKQTAQRRSN